MPQDIRSFFGGGGGSAGGAKAAPPKAPAKETKKSRASRKVISDDEDEEVVKPKKTTTPKKKPAPKPKVEETTSSAYFASNKSKASSQSTPAKKTASAKATPNKATNGATNGATPSTGRRSTRKAGKKSYAEDDEDDAVLLAEDKTGDDDIFADNFKNRKGDDEYEEASSDDDVVIKPTKKRNGVKAESEDDEVLEMAEINGHDGPKDSNSKTTATRKRKSRASTLEDDEDEEQDETPKKKAKKTTTSKAAPRKPAKKKTPPEEDKDAQALMDSIPTVRAPTPPPRDGDRKFTFAQGGGNGSVEPLGAGSKEIPEGADDCLLGLTFVFTGVLESLGREEGQSLVKRYGGKCTSAPSGKTSFVVLGSDAGPKKLETIRKLGIKTINEDGLFELIRRRPAAGGSAVGAEAAAKKRADEEAKVKKEAEEMERKELERKKEAAKIAQAKAKRTGSPAVIQPDVDSRLWVDKYAPDSLAHVCGNKSTVEKLQKWLRAWKRNHKFGFKQPGADGTGVYRAAMLHGPPGIGKTTAAHLIAKLEGYDIVETNASDTRSKKLMESALKGVLDTTSIMGYFATEGKDVDRKKQNLVLVMDEVDGMSAGDRGGVGALAAVAKKTNIPLIMICNERRLPKMKPFDHVTADFGFRRPTTEMIRSRINTICFREGIKLPPPVLHAMIEGGNADIRRIINMLSTIKINNAHQDLDFQGTKDMHKAWEKNIILKPWDIISKIMRPQMFAASGGGTLNEKTELYFNDHEFSYLMMQENYLKANPSRLGNLAGKERNLKWLELADNAASSISDGDLVDRMIHGSQQQWSLMPVHAIFSFVRPASFVHGNFNTQVGFAGWLGMNSKQGKLSRYVKEIQSHMRLKTAADRNEVRQQYLPALWNGTVGKLIKDGKEAVDDMIDFMDSYYLTKDDYDAIMELGVGPITMEGEHPVTKKIDTQTKSTFTRLYNSRSHPMPFVKASNVLGMSSGGAAKRDKPDLEEAVEDEDEIVEEVEADDDELDLKKDKYIKAPKKKKAAAKGKAAGAKRKKADDADEDGEDEDDVKPAKKGRGGGAAGRGRGRGRGRGS